MSKGSVNKVILIGNLGADPEIRYSNSGGQIANLRVATTESWKDKNSGETQEKTEWHRVSVFGKLAEICGKYLTKGAKVYLEGRIQTRKWQDDTGADRYSTEIVADQMQMLDRRQDGQGQAPTRAQAPAPGPQGGSRPAPAPRFDPGLDDDIPF